MEEHLPSPPGRPGHRLRNPLSIVLIAAIVIGLVTAGLLASALYARHRAENVLAAAASAAKAGLTGAVGGRILKVIAVGRSPTTATIREGNEFGTCNRAGAADRDPGG